MQRQGKIMEKEKYRFHEYQSSLYYVDPVFKSKDFTLFGNAGSVKDDPDLFEVCINQKRLSYCLIEPRKICQDEEMLLKIKRYLLAHERNETLNNLTNTYFIGEMKKSIDVSSEFTNQNIVLVTYEMIEQWYPKRMKDIFDVIIRHILKNQKYPGEPIFFLSLDNDIVFVNPSLNDSQKRDYKLYMMKCMKEEGLISMINDGVHIDCFILTAKAVDSIENLEVSNSRMAFIAIKFDKNEERINAIQNAISIAGYEPVVMNQVETNNWIMPEIFFQIKNSKFMVADFSLPCDGAYYEAGYAAALDKPVIHLFDKREENNNKLHFDIAQKSTIFYSDFDDLKDRLFKRIKATIR